MYYNVFYPLMWWSKIFFWQSLKMNLTIFMAWDLPYDEAKEKLRTVIFVSMWLEY